MKKIKRFLAALMLAFFGVSCGYTAPYYYTRQPIPDAPALIMEVKIDKEFSDSDKREIDKALMQWNYVLNGHYQFKVVDWNYDASALHDPKVYYRDAFYFVKITGDESNNYNIKKDNKDSYVLAFAGIGGTITYVIRERLSVGDVYFTVMHEIAHMLGADHNKFRLMNPSFNHTDFQCVDEKTAVQVAKFLGLKLTDLNWCFYLSD